MHWLVILATVLVGLRYFPGTTLVFTLLIGSVVYFGFIANPQGNLSPQMITKLGLEKPKTDNAPGDPFCWEYKGKFDNPDCEDKPAKSPTANGPVAIKPLPPRRVN